MTRKRLLLCFELQSPLHIGFLPNRPGTVLAPSRCYVPGKNMWGAVTAGLTPKLFKAPTAAHFHQVGEMIKRQLFFSYFYFSDGRRIFRPHYTKDGLMWGSPDELADRVFRACFLESYVSTAVKNEAGIAEEASLHEIEFVRYRVGLPGEPSQKVMLVGVVWISNGAGIFDRSLRIHKGSVFLDDLDLFEEITAGGERNYGFGRLKRVDALGAWVPVADGLWRIAPDEEIRLDEAEPLIGHLPYRRDCLFFGDIEILAGREYDPGPSAIAFENPGKSVLNYGHYFVPGTRVRTGDIVQCDSWGRLSWKN